MLEALEEILGVSFKPSVEVDYLNLIKVEDGDRFRKEGRTLHLNLIPLAPKERREILQLVQSQFEEEGRVLRHDEEEETSAMVSEYSEDFDEMANFFDGFLSERWLKILEKALHLRVLIEERDLAKEDIQKKKGQIARWHGANAMYVSSLATAGYFDPDGGLRDLFVDMGLNSQYNKYNFQQTLEEYAQKKLLCEFVENDDSVENVTQDVRGGLAKYQREEPIQEWFDIRGIGDGCAKIIDGVMENLEDEFIGIDYNRWTDGSNLWVRIYPRSLQPILL